MIIGEQAGLNYREPRFANDINIPLGKGVEAVNIILRICQDLNFRILVENPIDFTSQTMVMPVYDEGSKIRIDFIFSTTHYERVAIAQAKMIKIDGYEIAFC